MKPIVCGTDFSAEAAGALAWVAAMARREGCDISLVFAIRDVSVGSSLLRILRGPSVWRSMQIGGPLRGS
jgi:hypothetical protein